MNPVGIDTTFLVELEIRECPRHAQAAAYLHERILERQRPLGLCPQVLTEFIHIVTESKRFETPLRPTEAVNRTEFWWNAREVLRVFPDAAATNQFLRWMAEHSLGRKRILNTLLAATYHSAGIHHILTTNIRDFSIYPEVEGILT